MGGCYKRHRVLIRLCGVEILRGGLAMDEAADHGRGANAPPTGHSPIISSAMKQDKLSMVAAYVWNEDAAMAFLDPHRCRIYRGAPTNARVTGSCVRIVRFCRVALPRRPSRVVLAVTPPRSPSAVFAVSSATTIH